MTDPVTRMFKQSRGEAHARLALHLVGHGVELPGGAAFPVPYAGVDLVAAGDLRTLEPASQGFVIASHVLGQADDPVQDLADMERALAPGGALLILLPDRRRAMGSPAAGEQRWSEDEFSTVLVEAVRGHDQRWELVDALFTDDVDAGDEFGYVLRRATAPLEPHETARRLAMALATLRRRTRHLRALHERLEEALRDLAVARGEAAAARTAAERAEHALTEAQAVPGYPMLRATQQLGSAFRRTVTRST
jgi:uncharacterized protein YjiS (DUF1127 family)